MRGNQPRKGTGRKRIAAEILKRYIFRIRPEVMEILKSRKMKICYQFGDSKNG